MRAQTKTPARFGDQALGLEFPSLQKGNPMRNVRNRASARNLLTLPLWRHAANKARASYAVRHLAKNQRVTSLAQAALYADLIGYPVED